MMAEIPGLTQMYATFALYLLLMIAVGLYFYRRAKNIEDYLLGGRGMGSWVTALSAQASDMSGWLLMALPGAVFMAGLGECWIAAGLALGTFLNWLLVAPRLRLYTASTHSLTLSTFFERRFRDPTRLLRLLTALLTLFFFTFYAASGLLGAGNLFRELFGINFTAAVLIGTAVMVFYTLLGGFLAVCWTDLFQGILMFAAIVILPLVAYWQLPPGALTEACAARGVALRLLPERLGWPELLAILSTAAWGLGYFGQPHILVRFMGIKSIRLLPRSMTIAMIWVLISLTGAVLIGLLAVPFYDGLDEYTSENVFIYLVKDLFNPALGGVLLAAILAAIMSTIDSQLLVSSSTLTEDFYVALINPRAGEKSQMLVSRGCVLLIALIACSMALTMNKNIFDLVNFAWGGFGAAFGPAVLTGLYSRRTTWQAVLAGIVVGTVVLIGWYLLGWNRYMYEIVPGFLANFLTILLVNRRVPQTDARVLAEFDQMRMLVKKRQDFQEEIRDES